MYAHQLQATTMAIRALEPAFETMILAESPDPAGVGMTLSDILQIYTPRFLTVIVVPASCAHQ